ncbi:hypothetical protein MKX03_006111 [Papaver bracteatum]|nr:hypothetical protein MKX03_006111 [Papaver bracteatum]
MSDFMNVDVVNQLHPEDIVFDDVAKQAQLAVQVNLFDCGGIAISVCLSHKSISSWAASARIAPDKEIVYPTFDSAEIFPALPPGVQVSSLEADASVQGENPRSLPFVHELLLNQDVSALIWKSFMETSRVKVTHEFALSTVGTKPIITKFAVNLRTRLNPPLPRASFNNIIMDATAESILVDHDENTLGFLRLGVSKMNDEYIRKLQEGDVEFLKSLDEASHHSNGGENTDVKIHICWISSICRLLIDFGWGKPSWVVLNTYAEYKNSLFLMDTKCGTCTEAWVSLEEEDMAIFEEHQDIVQYATFDTPDPITRFTDYPFICQGNTM